MVSDTTFCFVLRYDLAPGEKNTFSNVTQHPPQELSKSCGKVAINPRTAHKSFIDSPATTYLNARWSSTLRLRIWTFRRFGADVIFFIYYYYYYYYFGKKLSRSIIISPNWHVNDNIPGRKTRVDNNIFVEKTKGWSGLPRRGLKYARHGRYSIRFFVICI